MEQQCQSSTESKDHSATKYDAQVALLFAATRAYEAEFRVERSQFYASALRGRPQVRSEIGHAIELRYGGQPYRLKVYRTEPRRYRIEENTQHVGVSVERMGPSSYRVSVFEQEFPLTCTEQESSFHIEIGEGRYDIARDDGGVVRAPYPAVVVSIAVQAGDKVAAGQRIAVLEAMKMETEVTAPFAGTVRQVMAIPNVQVAPGDPILQLQPCTPSQIAESTERIVFHTSTGPSAAAPDVCEEYLRQLRQMALGFDVTPEKTPRELHVASEEDTADRTRQCEDEILNIFVDLAILFRTKPNLRQQLRAEAPSSEAYLFAYLRALDLQGEGLPAEFTACLRRALAHYGIMKLDRSSELEESLLWIQKSHQRIDQQSVFIMTLLQRRLAALDRGYVPTEAFRAVLDHTISMTRDQFPALHDLAGELRYRCFDRRTFEQARSQVYTEMDKHLDCLAVNPEAADSQQRRQALVECPQPLASLLSRRFANASPNLRQTMMEVLTSRYYMRRLTGFQTLSMTAHCFGKAEYDDAGKHVHVFIAHSRYDNLSETLRLMQPFLAQVSEGDEIVLDLLSWSDLSLPDAETSQKQVHSTLNAMTWSRPIRRIVVCLSGPDNVGGGPVLQHFTYEKSEQAYDEIALFRGIHPMMAERLHLWRLQNFQLKRLPSVEDVYLLHGVANENPKDERLFAIAEVRDLTPVRDANGKITQLPHLERMFAECVAAIRQVQMTRTARERLYWNRILLYVWPTLSLTTDEVNDIAHRLAPMADGLGLEQVTVRVRVPNSATSELRDTAMQISAPGDAGLLITLRSASKLQPLKPLTAYEQKVIKMRQRGLLYPFEIVKVLTTSREETQSDLPPGSFTEYDFDAQGSLAAVDRPYGQNTANIIVGVIRNFTPKCPEGMTRVALLGDPSRELGALAEPECRRIIAALDLARSLKVPLEWFTLSAGAKISMSSGVENMDWIALVLRAIIDYTQAGGEINLIVNGINVGAQPYWNAEATMLMHTRGILIMTPKAAMVLTGKRALDYSGSISADDNQGIGGYDRIMGFNGQAQYFARDIDEACQILMRHYDHTYVVPGERFPRRAVTNDALDRDVQLYPLTGGSENGFTRVGDIFSDETNPGRKKAFDIRNVMLAVTDQDHPSLERWAGMRSAETAVVWDAHIGGYPVCLLGIESKPVPRFGFVPADGPDHWTAGTLFPLSSKKLARAINSASSNRPLVVLANLSGFDGSPDSMRSLQLEYGAEIGRAVVNFKGPMVFCVVSRYHGGAYVVFSHALNEQLEVIALEGTYASVIGGAPAAAVVFAGEVEARAKKDPRMETLAQAMNQAQGAEKSRLRAEWNELFKVVHSEKLGEMAAEFDHIHSVHRALEVGALHRIIPPVQLRPYLIDAIGRGIDKDLAARIDKRDSASSEIPENEVALLQAD